MGRSWQEKACKDHFRREKILRFLSENGKASSLKMAERFNTTRGQIIKDIAELRKKGHNIQTSSMATEKGMYVAVFELPANYRLKQ